MNTNKNGCLLQSRKSVFGEKVFLCLQGYKHLMVSSERIIQYGFRWPEDVIAVPEIVLKNYLNAGHVPAIWNGPIDFQKVSDSVTMREAMASGLTGAGIEIGAGASPFPIPLSCKVCYGDRLSYNDLVKEIYPGQSVSDLVVPDLQTDFDKLSGIADESMDFIIGCHVIEHTKNPIGSIILAHKKLKAGGKLLLCIPDKERTFDRKRPITSLEHLVEDFKDPDRERDLEHYKEFYRLSFPIDDTIKYNLEVCKRFKEEYAIHYHVWDHSSFRKMLEWINNNIQQWSGIWSHPSIGDTQDNIEFYAVLTK